MTPHQMHPNFRGFKKQRKKNLDLRIDKVWMIECLSCYGSERATFWKYIAELSLDGKT